MTVHIELAQPEDWSAIQTVFGDAGRAAWTTIFPPEALLELNPPDRWRNQIGKTLPEAEVWAAYLEFGGLPPLSEGEPASPNQLVAFAIIRPSGDEDADPTTGEVDSFYTHPDVWGQGVGRALMTHALGRLRNAGFQEATLWTEERNTRPRRFYETYGFKLDGTDRRRDARGASLKELRHRIRLVN